MWRPGQTADSSSKKPATVSWFQTTTLQGDWLSGGVDGETLLYVSYVQEQAYVQQNMEIEVGTESLVL